MSDVRQPGRVWRLLCDVVVPAIAIAAPFVYCAVAPAAGPPPLDGELAEAVETFHLPGIAAVRATADGVVDSGVAGVRRVGGEALQLDDALPIGSNGKMLTAALAASLVDDDAIMWETTIGEVWPDGVGGASVHEDFAAVTLEELLTHQSGMRRNVSRRNWPSYFGGKQTPTDDRLRLVGETVTQPATRERGTYAYSNVGYAVAGAMLEARAGLATSAGESFESLMQTRVFDPLAMTTARFHSPENTADRAAWGHTKAPEKSDEADGWNAPVDPADPSAENPPVYAPCSMIALSMPDYGRYLSWLLSDSPGPVLKNDATKRKLLQPLVKSTGSSESGLGWDHHHRGNGRELQHVGSNTNCYSNVWLFPDEGYTVVATTNTAHDEAFAGTNDAVVALMKRHRRGIGSDGSRNDTTASQETIGDITIDLLGIHDPATDDWWSGDGQPLDAAEAGKIRLMYAATGKTVGPGPEDREVVFRLTHAAAPKGWSPRTMANVIGQPIGSAPLAESRMARGTWVCRVFVPAATGAAGVRLEVLPSEPSDEATLALSDDLRHTVDEPGLDYTLRTVLIEQKDDGRFEALLELTENEKTRTYLTLTPTGGGETFTPDIIKTSRASGKRTTLRRLTNLPEATGTLGVRRFRHRTARFPVVPMQSAVPMHPAGT